jgi:hypothetical protein
VAEREIAEAAGEGDLTLVVEALVAEEANPVLDQGPADLRDRVRAELGGGVDAPDLGADPAGQGLDGEIHGGVGSGRHVALPPLARP